MLANPDGLAERAECSAPEPSSNGAKLQVRQGSRPRTRRVALAILPAALMLVALAVSPRLPGTAGAAATGAIEGVVTVPSGPAARTVERYISTDGTPREVPVIPVVVFVQGHMPSPAAARPSADARIAQRNETFDPEILVVPVGKEVEFPNEDPVFHNVFSYSRPKRFDLGRYRQGESKSVVFDRPGYIKVMCEVHKWMRAGILVVENPYYAIVRESGRFRIEGLPPGEYRLGAEHFDRRSQVFTVDVPEGGTATVQVEF
jgi:plastocyanin